VPGMLISLFSLKPELLTPVNQKKKRAERNIRLAEIRSNCKTIQTDKI
jgi:hypothetical protein